MADVDGELLCRCPGFDFAAEDDAPDPVYAGPRITRNDPLGAGIVRPFYRTEHADFANDEGVEEVLSNVGQVLGTRRGSLPWNLGFGSDLHLLRHLRNTPALKELARTYAEEALTIWEPRARLVDVQVVQPTSLNDQNVATLRGFFAIGIAQKSVHPLDIRF